MDWAPITRDCVVFAVNVIVLIGKTFSKRTLHCGLVNWKINLNIGTTWDGYIYWYEAMIIMLFAIPYYIIMFQSPRINRFLQRKFEVEYGCCNRLNLGDNGRGNTSTRLINTEIKIVCSQKRLTLRKREKIMRVSRTVQ